MIVMAGGSGWAARNLPWKQAHSSAPAECTGPAALAHAVAPWSFDVLTSLGERSMSAVGINDRTIGVARAKAKIGLQNLAYNIRRLVTLTLERTAGA
jgi:hypothetical protein